MRCEEVQKELAREPVEAVLREAMESHVAGCHACESVRLLYARMDETLKREPVWEPPEGFARSVAARAPRPALSRAATARLVPSGVLNAAILGLLVAAAGYLGARLLEMLTPMTVWLVLDYTAAALDAYEQFAGLASEALVVNAIPVAWVCAGLSLWAAAWFTRRTLA